jgi:hypothetical protein
MPVTSGFSWVPIIIEFKKFIKKINIGIEVPEELLEGVMSLGVNTAGAINIPYSFFLGNPNFSPKGHYY